MIIFGGMLMILIIVWALHEILKSMVFIVAIFINQLFLILLLVNITITIVVINVITTLVVIVTNQYFPTFG